MCCHIHKGFCLCLVSDDESVNWTVGLRQLPLVDFLGLKFDFMAFFFCLKKQNKKPNRFSPSVVMTCCSGQRFGCWLWNSVTSITELGRYANATAIDFLMGTVQSSLLINTC